MNRQKIQEFALVAEIVAAIAIVASLLFLANEVRENTRAMEAQFVRDRSEAIASPFLDTARLPKILEKIKAIDGIEPLEQAYMDRYELTHEEASIWTRYQDTLWKGLQAEYVVTGATPELEAYIKDLLMYPDVDLSWEQRWGVSNTEFIAYVEQLQNEL